MKKYLFVIMIVLLNYYSFAQDTTVNWLSFEQAKEKFTKYPKPIVIFAYSKSDSVSSKMLNSTIKNSEVANYLNVLFYPIKLDVESTDTIVFFNNEVFTHNKTEKHHSLAKVLLGDTLKVPALVMFGEKGQGRAFTGFKNRDSIFPILIYYAEEVYNSITYEVWSDYYFETYPPGRKQIITHLNIHWMKMDEMLEKQKTNPRKVIIDIYNNYNISSTIMRLRVYNNAEIARYLNNNYYPVTVQLRSKEEFEIKGASYKNSGNAQEYHQFAIAVLSGVMKFPAFVILDEDFNLLDRIQSFTTREKLDKIIHYYGDNKYKE